MSTYNNFSVSEINFLETAGADLGNTGIYTISITPDQGYSIDVNNFSIVAPFSPYIDQTSITLAQSSNVVIVNFNLNQLPMPANDLEIPLCVSGFVTLEEFTIDGTYVYETTNFTPPGDGTYSESGEFNSTEPVLSQTINAGANKYFPTEPQAAIIIGNNNSYDIQSSIVTDSDGDIISKTFNINYTYPNQSIAGDKIKFVANAADKVNVSPKINSFTVDGVSGYLQPNITNAGETKPLILFGNEGATVTSINLYDTSGPPQLIAGYGGNFVIPASGSITVNITFPAASAGYSVPYRIVIVSPDINPNLLPQGATDIEIPFGQDAGSIDFVFTPTTTNTNMTVSGALTATLNPDSAIDPASGLYPVTFTATPNAGYALVKLTQSPATANDFNPTIPNGTGNAYAYTGFGTSIQSNGNYVMPGSVSFSDTGPAGESHTLNMDAFVTTVANNCLDYELAAGNGGDTTFTFTDCCGVAQSIVMSPGDPNQTVCSSTPVLFNIDYGGTATNLGTFCACFLPVQLGYSATSYEDACCAVPSTYYIDGTTLLNSTGIFTDASGNNAAPDGFYAQ